MVLRVQSSSKIKLADDLFQKKDNDTVKTSTTFNIDLKEAKRLDGGNMMGLVLERSGARCLKNLKPNTAPKAKTEDTTTSSPATDTTEAQKTTKKGKAHKSKTKSEADEWLALCDEYQKEVDPNGVHKKQWEKVKAKAKPKSEAEMRKMYEEHFKDVMPKEEFDKLMANTKKALKDDIQKIRRTKERAKIASTVKASNGMTYVQIEAKLREIIRQGFPLACDKDGSNPHTPSIDEAWEWAKGGPLREKMEPLMKARKELQDKYPILKEKIRALVGPDGTYWPIPGEGVSN